MILEHVIIMKKTNQQDEIHQILLLRFYLKTIQHLKYKIKWKKTIQIKFNNFKMFKIWKLVKQSLN